MSGAATDRFHAERVIVAFDAAGYSTETWSTAVQIAMRLGAAVTGLLIEDANLFRLASLPAALHVQLGSAEASLSIEGLESELRALAQRAEAELRAIADREGISWAFRVLRGAPAAELRGATLTHDLLILGASRGVGSLPVAIGSPLREAARQAAQPTLLLPRGGRVTRPMVLTHAGSRLTARAIDAARRVFGAGGSELDVRVIGEDFELKRLSAELATKMAGTGLRPKLRLLSQATVAGLARAAHETGSDVLVIAADTSFAQAVGELDELMAGTACQILLVR